MKALFFFLFILILTPQTVNSQSLMVVPEQEMDFGTFYITGTAEATLEIDNMGNSTSSSNLFSLNSLHQAAVFTISTDSSTPIHVQVDRPQVYLKNSEGASILFQTSIANPETSIIQVGAPAQIVIGGTLTIPALSTPGNYSGQLFLNFTIINE